MHIDEFVKPYAEKLLQFKKNVFTLKNSHDFLRKLADRGDLEKMESELTKCLLNSINKDNENRKLFIYNFIESFKNHSSELINNKISELESNEVTLSKSEKEVLMGLNFNKKGEIGIAKGNKSQNDDFIQRKFKMKNKESEFPTLENLELVNRKKNFEVLDHHYIHKLEKGNKICFCMSNKHPLVGNCLNCGRIQCLQEGDKECIVCGNPILKKEEYLKLCTEDKEMKKSYNHKEKLLNFQADFYSRLQIIDDFQDWYELSKNTWISKDNRELAKKKDEEIERIKDDPEFEYSLNLKTGEVNKIYEKFDETKMKDDITNFFIDNIRKQKKPKQDLDIQINRITDCRAMTEKAIKELKYNQTIKNLSKKIEIDTNKKIGDELAVFNKHILENIENMTENDNFLVETDVGMCLSMHQPWASLLIEGFKRYEGREWDSDYRGILWIHATSKKPDQEIIDSVQNECDQLYIDCKNRPMFPKRYPTSCLLGSVDLVDVLKREVYQKLIPSSFREKTDSKFLFVCKNPRKLDIPIKMPGQTNLYKLDEQVMERTKDRLIKINTFWWPCPGHQINLIDIPFSFLLHPEIKSKATIGKTINKNSKIKVSKLCDELNTSVKLIQNYIVRERKENIISLIETNKKEFLFKNDYFSSPFIKYGLYQEYQSEYLPMLLKDMFKDIQTLFRDDKNLKIDLKLISVVVEYLDWYGCINFRQNKFSCVKLFIGNPSILSILTNSSDIQGKSIRIDCGDIIYITNNLIYSVNQVLYDGVVGSMAKMKQGVLMISFNCN